MGYHLLEYVLVDVYLARRAALRDEHLALAQAQTDPAVPHAGVPAERQAADDGVEARERCGVREPAGGGRPAAQHRLADGPGLEGRTLRHPRHLRPVGREVDVAKLVGAT